MAQRTMALAAYRHVLRAIPIAFKGDLTMLNGARHQARVTFDQNRTKSDEKDISDCIQHAEDVAMILRQNVVQGSAAQGSSKYKLNIHDETERGDNDTIKMAGQVLKQK